MKQSNETKNNQIVGGYKRFWNFMISNQMIIFRLLQVSIRNDMHNRNQHIKT